MAAIRIGFIGTGLMGEPMARRLLQAGFPVTAYNRSREKTERLAPDAKVAESAAAAATDADVVFTMVSDGAAVTDLLFGQGVAAAMKPGAVLVDMSSIAPSSARDHSRQLQALGVHHVDAPVSGGTVGATLGTLAIMAGGEADIVASLAEIFAPMGRATYVGPSGSGQLSKLANQAIVAITIGAVSEALLLAAAGGANPAAVRDAIRGGFAESRILELHGQRMIDRNFVPGGPSKLQLKDLDNVLTAAKEAGVVLPLTQNVRDLFAELVVEHDGAMLDHSALLLQLEAMNSPHRVGTAVDRR